MDNMTIFVISTIPNVSRKLHMLRAVQDAHSACGPYGIVISITYLQNSTFGGQTNGNTQTAGNAQDATLGSGEIFGEIGPP